MAHNSFPIAPIILMTTALCAAAGAAEPKVSPKASAHFKLGVRHLDAGQFDRAYEEFKTAYTITPSWKILGNLGIAADKLERDGEAIDAFEEYLRRGKLSAWEAREVKRDLKRVREAVAFVTIEGHGTLWIVDTRIGAKGRVINEYGPYEERAELRVRAGQHEFRLDSRGAGASSSSPVWAIPLLPSDTVTHSFIVEPEPEVQVNEPEEPVVPVPTLVEKDVPPPAPSHTGAYVLWGAGALGAGATVAMVLQANRLQSDADQRFAANCPLGLDKSDATCNRTVQLDAHAAKWRTVGLLTGIGAGAALLTGTIVYSLTPSSSKESTQATWQPWVSPMGVGVSGAF